MLDLGILISFDLRKHGHGETQNGDVIEHLCENSDVLLPKIASRLKQKKIYKTAVMWGLHTCRHISIAEDGPSPRGLTRLLLLSSDRDRQNHFRFSCHRICEAHFDTLRS